MSAHACVFACSMRGAVERIDEPSFAAHYDSRGENSVRQHVRAANSAIAFPTQWL